MTQQSDQLNSGKRKKFMGPLIALVIVIVLCATAAVSLYGEYRNHNQDSQASVTHGVTPVATSTATLTIQGRRAHVLAVVDGDTLDVSFATSTQHQRIRLIGVNTPESVDKRKPVQCFGKEASAYTASLINTHAPDRMLTFVPDQSQGEYDKYGRYLAYAYFPDGSMLNEMLIRDGYGFEYTYRTPYDHQKLFKEAQASARDDGRGLWSTETCSGKV